MSNKKKTPKMQLCWTCRHAIPDAAGTRGCSWSRDGEPVEGWTATYRIYDKRFTGLIKETYDIEECPQYEVDK